MNAVAKLGAYGLVLAAALGGGAALGSAAGPIDVDDAPSHDPHSDDMSAPGHGTEEPDRASPTVGGLSVAESGHRLVPEDRLADAGEFAFTIEGPDGETVTEYDVEHEKRLHLVVASRDLQHYRHLHPDMDDDGRWSVELPELPAGSYRAFADFHATGAAPITLGVDLTRPGSFEPAPTLTSTLTDVVDGYEVRVDGDPRPGSSGVITVTVARDGTTVLPDPYLGARGHLVALREGDLAYLHVHPLPDQGDDAVRFRIEVPSAGAYALFFDFAHEGAVRTARFAFDTAVNPAPSEPVTDDHAGSDAGHAHD